MKLEYIYKRHGVVAVAYQDCIEVARSNWQPSWQSATSDVARILKAKERSKR